MTTPEAEGTENSVRRAWNLGVRARLLLAFFGISTFAVLAAAAGIYSFREVGGRLDVVDARVQPTLSALELSRSAERIIAAAPALVAATDRKRRDEVKAELSAEIERLNATLLELKGERAQALPMQRTEPVVSALTTNLSKLDGLVARRLESTERVGTLRRNVFQTSAEVQRLLAPWLDVTDSEISAQIEAMQQAAPNERGDGVQPLASKIQLQRLIQTAQRRVSATADMLTEASTTEQAQRLTILEFQLGIALRDLDETAAGLGPKLRPLFLEQVGKLREYAEGLDAITDARRQELSLTAEGRKLLAETAYLSAQLTAAVDQVGNIAKIDISEAIYDALSVQRLGTRVLVTLVVLSLLTSALIVWLYVSGNIVRRLTGLSAGMLAIAGGRLHAPFAVEGSDEIAAMARAVEIFRRNTLERDELLADKAQAADRLEEEVEQRTRELSEALEQQLAASEILRTIARSPGDAQPVFDTVAKSVARLCDVRFCQVFRFDGELIHFAAHHGLVPEAVEDIRRTYPMAPGRGSAAARAILKGEIEQIPDIDADPDYGRRHFAKLMGFRGVVAVPMLKDNRPIGAIAMARSQTGQFPERHIELLRTFADQAVIAIENARLFEEAQTRTREVSKALEQQTATAEILQVISVSPTDVQRVFDAIARNAVSLCGGLFANVFRFDGELLYFAASYNTGPSYVGLLEEKYPMRPDTSQVSGRVLLTRSVVHLEDALADPDYDKRFPPALGWRRMLGVPMLRKGVPVGVVVVGWAEPGPVSPAQEALLKTFADQAVIAIENARLFDEIQDKTRQLEIADKYKSHFLASASHDLRQPLHALNLFVAQLRTATDSAERDKLVSRIDAATGSMNELFGSLLDMSKLEAGILDPHFTEFPVERVLDHIEATFADAARQKGLRLAVVPSSAWVRSDFILFERILMNLVSNAVRYTMRGGVVIGCRRRGKQLRVDVCDSGPGIPPDQRDNIFGEYYRLAAAGPDRGGLGLGLAIVERLGRLLEHQIELDSSPGRGSRFSVSVPLIAERRGLVEAPIWPAIADPARGKLVLVIDDDPLVLEGMGGILRSWGCNVLTADSEEAAHASLSAKMQRPDLVISDYRLASGKTGIEAIERLRDTLGAPIPAFLISGDTAPERLRDASENGFHLLHKPVAPMRLRALLNQLLKASAPRAARPAAE